MHHLFVLSLLASSCLGFLDANPLDNRIVGGEPADISEFPYQVALTSFSSVFCGGSILNATLILTAAHCTHGKARPSIYVYAGTNTPAVGPNFYTLQNIFEHPKFDLNSVDNDIAILQLRSPLKFSDKIKAVPLVKKGYNPPVGKMATVTGFGRLAEGGEKPKGLNKLQVPILDRKKCNQLYSAVNRSLTEHMFCAGYEAGGKDSCQGDSGGPLVLDGMQIGVVSWGYGCARPGLPGVYTHISTLLDFIELSVGPIINAVY